ncbi:type 1 glutamine amidotransferase family protein [Clostridium sp. OS1-26]|uniref:type 1 glutamine amidotransferase family protein n=1 Tax=Clostridium sp. OS1-26 TaxID=3070681 RepID=UPI0027DFECB0|nr:type 1 glutamine amidotransferase family protein [Clostridium sp. OS1-26]WML33474.1 type 1 glutamine amidotransferase family protein [Clostridium sp. OS1-26]
MMNNIKNGVLIVLTERWNDWEASYAISVINSFSDYEVKTIAVDDVPKTSMGGINASIDYNINDYQNFNNLAMVILPGGLSWEENDHREIAEFIKKLMELHIPVAAICGAATFLCKHGVLDNVKHTGDSLELFQKQKGYRGEAFYIPAQVVVDNKVITANETAAVQFAYEIFKILEIDSDEEMAQWYDNFKNGAIR